MIKNYLKTAFRNLLRHKTFSLINIFGLSAGLTCCLLIFTFVADEYSYDQFHDKKDRIYRVQYFIQDYNLGRVPPIFASHIGSFFPEVEKTARLFARSVSVRVPDAGEDKSFEEPNVNFADSSLFEMFTFEIVKGSLKDALRQPFTVVLNEEIAEKYFGASNPIGRQLLMEGDHTFKVTAVVKDFPANSHVHFDMLVPYQNMYDLEPDGLRQAIEENYKVNWMISHSPTYVLLKPGADPEAVNAKFADFVQEKVPEAQQKNQSFNLQPLSDIHLNSDVQAQAEPSGSMTFIYIFIAVGALTLLIACINFVNLSTARSLQRTKEIGMRKVLGAGKQSLIAQFLGESFLTTLLATVLAVWFTVLLIPQMNQLTGKELGVENIFTPLMLPGLLGLVIITGLLAGLYPAFFVTRLMPLNSLKGQVSKRNDGGLSFRKGLVIAQFCISMVLISSTLIVLDQLQMLRNKPLGFQKEHMIAVAIHSDNFNNVFGGVDGEKRQKMNAFENALKNMPGVIASTVSSNTPGDGMVSRNIIPEGFTAKDNMLSPVMAVDYDFIDTYQIELIAGRSFSIEYGTDHENAFVLNEYAVKQFNFGTPEEAIGKSINLEGKEGKVVGVVRDFNFLPLTEPMSSLIMEINVPQFSVFSIAIDNQNIPTTLAGIENLWTEFFPDKAFEHAFLDETLSENYNNQEQLGRMVAYFSILAVIISCLGSYGLIMFIASRKVKEVGIRKVLGASVMSIVLLLSRRFVMLALIAMIISVPFTVWVSGMWLDDFSYRIDISPWSFAIAAFITLGLVLVTISFQAMRAAVSNPVKALRTE